MEQGLYSSDKYKKSKSSPQGKKLQNAIKIVVHLQAKANKFHATVPSSRKHINKYFHLVKVGHMDKSKPYNCQIVHKSHKMHQVQSI
jgi:hypothetical protein